MYNQIKIQVRAIVHTKKGRVFKTYPWKNANSLIKQFIQFIMVGVSQANQTIKDDTNTGRTVSAPTSELVSNAAINITTYGILIGSGTTPVTMEDIKIETQLTTNVAHAAMIIALENPNASTWRIALSRIFTNNTGGTLEIKEVTLYVRSEVQDWYFCVERTLYAVDVPDGYPITFQYKITITL